MTVAPAQVGPLNPIRALLRTNWRSFRLPAITLLLIGLAVYALGLIVYLRHDPSYKTHHNLYYAIAGTSTVAIALSTLIAAALGGMSIAGERADRTALFVAMLPVSRMQIALSKLAVSTLILISVLVVHLIVGGSALLIQFAALRKATLPGHSPLQLIDVVDSHLEPISLFIAAGFSMFCVAWLLGSFSKSPVISACTGIAVTLTSLVLLSTILTEHRASLRHYFNGLETLVPALVLVALGVPSLIAGTIIYLKRTEP